MVGCRGECFWCHASLKSPQTKKAKFTIDDAGFRCMYGGHTSINHTGITSSTRLKQGSMVALYAFLVLLSSSSPMVPANFLRMLRPKHICTDYVSYLCTYIPRAKRGTNRQIHH